MGKVEDHWRDPTDVEGIAIRVDRSGERGATWAYMRPADRVDPDAGISDVERRLLWSAR
jgi:hypothetical protein